METDAVASMMNVNRKLNRWQQMQTGTDDSKDRQKQMIEKVDRYRQQQRQTGTDDNTGRQEQSRAEQSQAVRDDKGGRQVQTTAELYRNR